jgi:hypothetical protein
MRIMRTQGADNTEMLTRRPDQQPATDAVIGVRDEGELKYRRSIRFTPRFARPTLRER